MTVLALVLPIFMVIVTGWIVGRTGILPAGIGDALVQFAYWIAMPALLFATIAQEPVERMLEVRFLLAFGGGSLLVLAVVAAWARSRHAGLPAASAQGFAASMTNTGFVALPILHGIFGAPSLLPAAAATLFVAIVLFPMSIVMLQGHGASIAGALRKSVLNPMVLSTLAGLAVAILDLPLPRMLTDYLNVLAGALTPCALFAVGFGMHLDALKESAGEALALTLVKLAGLPAVVLALGLLLGLEPFMLVAAVVCAAVPTAKTLYILAAELQVERDLVATTISATTLGSLLSLPVWLVALGYLFPEVFARP